ncbi:DMT family transporter [Pseudohalocynthiibacter aestuariivivens]|uniref:DMT family transporter n=1 Tax=Roseovarius pelagicus TaxID=2980108 RepID=A0ABY6DGR7_9RHOB|nr:MULTISPECIES: DMT family transporter [Rhodobacterales]QIE45081.1 DMT family transporter [Pseudohalocynthiibacter aestuariivivens]UXX82985.1 DMT family transporter [Roseovarius pelagicus]
MTAIHPHTAPPPSRALHGIACAEIGMLLFVVQDVLVKSLLDTHPLWHLIFVRSIITLVVLTPLILWLGGPHRILTPFWKLHLVRATLLAVGFSLFYAAFPFMGLAEVTTIFFSAPLMTALLAAVVLRETIGIHRTLSLIVGFVGVVIAMNPGSEGFSWVAILPLICALSYAISQILARQMGEQESTLTMGLQTITFMGLMILPLGWLTNQFITLGPEFHHLRMAWPTELARDGHKLILLGLVGMMGWMLLTRAYQVANASLVAPFDYTYMPIAIAVAWIFFDEMPPTTTWVGMTLIVGSGLYLGYRELRAARHGDDPTNVAEATFAPGTPMPPPTPSDEPDLP